VVLFRIAAKGWIGTYVKTARAKNNITGSNSAPNLRSTLTTANRVRYYPGADTGGPKARAPLFLAKSILFFYIVYNVWKKNLKLNLDFTVAEIRGFLEARGVYACVYESKSWPLLFFVQQRPHFE